MSSTTARTGLQIDPHRNSPNTLAPTSADGVSILRRLADTIRHQRVAVLVAIHAASFAVILPVAYLLRFDGILPGPHLINLLDVLPWVVVVKLAIFLGLRGHRGWWRYPTFSDVVSLAESTTVASLAVVSLGFLFQFGLNTPRSVIVLDWAGTLLLLGGLRGSMRLLRERYRPMIMARKATRVVVVGVREEGLALCRLLQSRQGPEPFNVVGLLDLDANSTNVGRTLGGIRVIGWTGELVRVAARFGIKTVLVPDKTVAPREILSLVNQSNAIGVKVQVVPALDALVNGTVTVQPRDVEIDDLLCRAAVTFDDDSVTGLVRGRVVMVTGAAGSIGSEICRQVLAYRPSRLVLLDNAENGLFFIERELRGRADEDSELVPVVASITDAARVRGTFERHRPAVVFHAAAHKHVPMMETNPGEAVKNNVMGTRIVVDEAIHAGVEAFVMISTDKAVRPSSVMGACKRLAEMYVQARSVGSSTRLVTVRFGNVLGSAGSVVPIFKEQIRRGGPVTVTHPEMTRYFMTIPEATQLVLQAGARGAGGEIFVLDMGEPVRVLDLARDLIRLSGLTEGREIEIAFTGLRPGEKLHEELLGDDEEPLPTSLPKVSVARHRPDLLERVIEKIDRLASTVNRTAPEVIAGLRDAVRDYRPSTAPAPSNRQSITPVLPNGQEGTTAPHHGSETPGLPA